MFDFILPLIPVVAIVFAIITVIIAIALRRVVEPNEVHVVQSSKGRRSYGKKEHGNTYYEWPTWLPVIGVTVIRLPVSNFNLSFDNYKAYDRDRVPFVVDITAFFKIVDTDYASENIESFEQLKAQLEEVVQGAVRTILANSTIDDIMIKRAEFGKSFTKEVAENVAAWGVKTVKDLELMDIRDTDDSKVIQNIMAKKKSFIEMESRKEVAENNKLAEIAEIQTKRDADLQAEEARQKVDQRTAEADQAIGISQEKSQQEIKEQAKITAEKDMAVKRVQQVKQAEIDKEKAVVKANEDKETTVLMADGDKQAEFLKADGIQKIGEANAAAEEKMKVALVAGDIALAEKIGSDEGYQKYLIEIRGWDAKEAIGKEQAVALKDAKVNVIANTGNAADGLNSVGDIFTPKGGTNLTGMVEAFAQSSMGKAIFERLGVKPEQFEQAVKGATQAETATGTVKS